MSSTGMMRLVSFYRILTDVLLLCEDNVIFKGKVNTRFIIVCNIKVICIMATLRFPAGCMNVSVQSVRTDGPSEQ
jgi:hypothetical protein